MAPLQSLVSRAFSAGELAPSLGMRADLTLYTLGLRTCRNFIVQRHGGVANRPGTKFIAEVKDSEADTWLLKFVLSATQTYVIEVGEGYFRFFKNAAPVTVSGVTAWSGATAYVVGDLASRLGVNYYCILAHTNQQPPDATYWYPLTDDIFEIPTPFLATLHNLRAVQDQAVVTLTHQDYPPQELVCAGDTAWTLTPIVTAPGIAAPANPTSSAGAAGSLNPVYVITAVAAETYEESLPSATETIASSAEPTDAAPNELGWDAVTGAAEYRVYKDPQGNGTFGYLGTATGLTAFFDAGFAPDFGLTPPIARTLFNATNLYPHAATYYQQRRVFANSHAAVATVWGSRIGFHSNFSIRSPLQDDDAVTFTLNGRRVQGIQHLLGLKRLILLSDGGEWVVHGDEAGVLTPSSIHPDQDGWAGSAAAPVPVVFGNTAIYVQYLSRIVRDLRFDANFASFRSSDLTVFASHLFEQTVVRIDGAEIPHSVIWCVRDDGVLLGLTYLPDHEIYGWHRHDTGASGLFKDVCVVPEGDDHAVYVVVQRTIDGATKRYVERFQKRLAYTDATLEDAFFLDCGLTQDGALGTSVTGLDHLEGTEVYALADGLVRGPFTVSAGAITLIVPAAKVQVGLLITAQLETLALDVAGSSLREKKKNVQAITAIVEKSVGGFYTGPDEAHLFRQKRDAWQPATGLQDDALEATLTGTYGDTGRVVIQHIEPTPLTILGLIPLFKVGG